MKRREGRVRLAAYLTVCYTVIYRDIPFHFIVSPALEFYITHYHVLLSSFFILFSTHLIWSSLLPSFLPPTHFSSSLVLPYLLFSSLLFSFHLITDFEDITAQNKFAFGTFSTPKRSILDFLLIGILVSLLFPCLVITCIYIYRTRSSCKSFPPEFMKI